MHNFNICQQIVVSTFAGGIVHIVTTTAEVATQADIWVLIGASVFFYLILEVARLSRRARKVEAKRAKKAGKRKRPAYGPGNPHPDSPIGSISTGLDRALYGPRKRKRD